MKLLRNTVLFLLVAVLAFSGSGMAWGADLYIRTAASGSSSAGSVSDSTTGGYAAKAYYVGTPANLPITVVISANDFQNGDVIEITSSTAGVSFGAPSYTVNAAQEITVSFTMPRAGGAVTLTSADAGGAVEADLNITSVPLTLSLTGDTAMTFYTNLPGTQTVTATATGLTSPTTATFAGLQAYKDGTATVIANPIWTGVSTTVAAPTITLTGTPTTTHVTETYNVKINSMTVSDNGATVAGIAAGHSIGTFTAKADTYNISLKKGTTSVSVTSPYYAKVGTPLTAASSFDVIDAPTGITVGTLKVSDDVSSTSTFAVAEDAVYWNGLTISADYSGRRKIEVTGTPVAAGTKDFRVFATTQAPSPAMTASADFRIVVTNYTMKLTPSTISADSGAAFNDKISLATVSEDSTKTFTSLKLTEGTRTDVASLDIWSSVVVSVDADNKTIHVNGTPATGSTGSKTVTVKGTVLGSGETIQGTLTITINALTGYTLVLSSTSFTATQGIYFEKVISASVSGAAPVPALSGLTLSPTVSRGLQATVNTTNYTITLRGTPTSTGTVSFAVTGSLVGGYPLTGVTLSGTVLSGATPANLVSEIALSWKVVDYYLVGGVQWFEIRTPLLLPSGVTTSQIQDIIATFTPGVVGNLNVDVVTQNGPWVYIEGSIASGMTPEDVILQAIEIILTNGLAYEQDNIVLTLKSIIEANNGGGSSGGGCDAGYGLAALVLAGAAWVLKRR